MFQSVINAQPAIGRAGEFCSANPRSSLLASAGGLTAGPAGLIVGHFAWADADGIVRNSGGVGRLGFCSIYQVPVVIQNWLGRTSNTIPAGYEVNLHASGDFLMQFAGGATVGNKVWANFADGSCVSSPTGVVPASAVATGTIAAATSSFTASIAPANPFNADEPGGIMTVTGAVTGAVTIGAAVAGTNVASGQTVVSQYSGTAGGDGVYEVSIAQTVVSETMTQAYGVFTAVSGLTGVFGVGDPLTGSGVSAGTTIIGLGTGTGGLGTYNVNNSQTTSSTAISAASAVETAWYVDTFAVAGDLAKTSRTG